jgi:hypothetical protein
LDALARRLGRDPQLQILWRIVGLDAISMMHILGPQKWPTNHFRHHKAMFWDPSIAARIPMARSVDLDIPMFVDGFFKPLFVPIGEMKILRECRTLPRGICWNSESLPARIICK